MHAGIVGGKKRRAKRPSREGAQRLRIDGAKLRRLREDAELSIRGLAIDVGIDPSTIADLEAGRREWSQLRVIRSIAAHPAIDVDYNELLVDAKPTMSNVDVKLPPRSSLDAYVDEERRIGPEQMMTARGQLPVFGATDLVRLFSSPSSVAGQFFVVRGRVHATRGLTITDGRVLGIHHQDGSRFEILRRIGSIPQPMSLTVVTTSVETTRRLQNAWTSQVDVALVVGVITTRANESDVFVTSLDGQADVQRPRFSGSEQWRGFIQIEPKTNSPPKPHPWALVVVSVLP